MANTAVFGIFPNRASLSLAIDALRASGFRNTDVSVLFPLNDGSKDMGHEKSTKAPEGAAAGATSGLLVGGVLGWLAGLGTLAIPGIGPFIAAGPIMAALAGAGGVGLAGGMVGGLIGLGVPEYEAKRYEGRLVKGGILLSVHCDNSDWVKKAETLLKENGADDVSSQGEAAADYARSERPTHR